MTSKRQAWSPRWIFQRDIIPIRCRENVLHFYRVFQLVFSGFQKFRSTSVLLFAMVVALLVQGCAVIDALTPATVYRGVTPQQAAELVERLAGNSKPANTTLSRFYQDEQKWTSWKGTWNCNNQLVMVMLINVEIKPGPGNAIEWTSSNIGACSSTVPSNLVGRYNDDYLYLYNNKAESTYILKYQIDRKSSFSKGNLVFQGALKYIDDVWTLHKAQVNPLMGVTGNRIAESGGPADMWESSEFRPQSVDPRVTAEQRRRDSERAGNADAGESARVIAGRAAERARDDAAENRANTQAALNKITQDLAGPKRGSGERQVLQSSVSTGSTGNAGTINRQAQAPSSARTQPVVASTSSKLPEVRDTERKPESTKMYRYNSDSYWIGGGKTAAQGCAQAESEKAKGPKVLYMTKLISTGSCSCGQPSSNGYGTYIECRIPYTVEVNSVFDPNVKANGPSQGVSR